MQKLKNNISKSQCIKCGLHLNCRSPKISVAGLGKKEILIINNFLTREDDKFNTHMNGDEFIYFETKLTTAGINLHNDCWRMSLTGCLPYHNGIDRIPTKKEIDFCFPNIQKAIKKLKPKKIILLGKEVCEKFYKKRVSKNITINKTRGTRLYDSNYDCWVYPITHPSEAVYYPNDEILETFYELDLKFIANSNSKFPIVPKINEIKNLVKLITNFEDVIFLLRKILKEKPYMAFDYEATGLKPYIKGHKIVSIGLATSSGDYASFPFQHKFYTKEQQKRLTKLWGKILIDGKIRKIAHNVGFEYIWSTILGGAEPNSMIWDTQLTTHVLDNRRGITSLKFQLFTRYGIGDYGKSSKKYISASEGEIFNRMEEMPIPDLLLYNAIDALGTLWLYNDQKKELIKNQKKALNFFFQGQLAFAQIHLNGMKMNTEYYKKEMKLNREKCNSIKKELLNTKEAKLYKKVIGKEICITSLDDLKLLFYDNKLLGLIPTKITEKGNTSLDSEALTKIGIPFAKKILEFRKIEKLGNTYLKNMLKETTDDYMHPFFNLHIPISYRSSSNMINFQNTPKRDPAAMTCIRFGIIPEDDYLLGEGDFSSAEVIVSGCHHQDKNFLNYLRDKNTDMHRDNACDLFLFEPEELNDSHFTSEQKKTAKNIRFYAKNMWTFAQFYGDWYGSCAPNLWEHVVEAGLMTPQGTSIKKHLIKRGIYTYEEFKNHCASVENKMWNERFPEYTQWKKDIVKSFIKNGHIEMFFGFLLTMLMDKKQCASLPIQGTSFHLLLYVLIMVHRELKKRKMKTKIIGQIHDSIIAHIYGPEFKEYRKILRTVIKNLPNKFPWLIIPIEVELEISKLGKCGGNFANMKEVPI